MNNRILLVPLALTLTLAACDDMLVETPEAFLTTETYYKTADDLDRATKSTIASLRVALNGFGVWHALENASDQGQSDPGEPNG